MRTLQEIYDFCRNNATYRAYYDVPDHFQCTQRQYRYLYGDLGNDHSRRGTYIYIQAQIQLKYFLGTARTSFQFDIDTKTDVILRRPDFGYPCIRVTANISGNGVNICFTHPFNGLFDNEQIVFSGRSHRPFSERGILEEVSSYIAKHLLLPPGRYRALQLQYKVPKSEFIPWYRNYQAEQHQIAEDLHRNMIDKYRRLTYRDAYRLLAVSGIFADFNCDEAERNLLTHDFVQYYNQH